MSPPRGPMGGSAFIVALRGTVYVGDGHELTIGLGYLGMKIWQVELLDTLGWARR